jgi:aryl-alcohol dehydrogenase-like predicted oxidoreductase
MLRVMRTGDFSSRLRTAARWASSSGGKLSVYLKRLTDSSRSISTVTPTAIGLYQYHRPDPKVPYADAVGVFKELLDKGKVVMVGISNVDVAQIDLARSVLGEGNLASVQNQFSPSSRSGERELQHCGRLGIAFLPYSPFGGIGNAERLRQGHPGFVRVASDHGASVQQVVLAWMLAKGDHVVPIPGCSRPASARDCARAVDLKLSDDELNRLEQDDLAV